MQQPLVNNIYDVDNHSLTYFSDSCGSPGRRASELIIVVAIAFTKLHNIFPAKQSLKQPSNGKL